MDDLSLVFESIYLVLADESPPEQQIQTDEQAA